MRTTGSHAQHLNIIANPISNPQHVEPETDGDVRPDSPKVDVVKDDDFLEEAKKQADNERAVE